MSSLSDRLQRALGSAYRVERELGGGGMSHVFLADEVALGRRVVIKLLPPELAAGVSAERFRREIQLAAQLQHPGIVPLLTAGADGDLLWYVMPYVDGESLRTRLARGPLPVDEAVRLWRDLLEALESAHGRGIVHRDIKPENIMLTGRRAVTLDFGVAKAVSASTSGGLSSATGVGFVVGTPAYMAPEQAAGDGSVDARADLYAAGLVMYEMLAGRGPFEARTPAEWMAAHIAQVPTPIQARRRELPASIADTLMACLAKLPSDRPNSASDALERLASETAVKSNASTLAMRTWRALLIAIPLVVALVAAPSVLKRFGASRNTASETSQQPLIADSARLGVAIMPSVRDAGDSIAANLFATAASNALRRESRLGVIDRNQLSSLAEDAGLTNVDLNASDLLPLIKDVGVQLYVQPTVARIGTGLLLSFDVYQTTDGASVFRVEEGVSGAESMSAVTARLADSLRLRTLGLWKKVPTPEVTGKLWGTSPEAARFYVEGGAAFWRADYPRAAELTGEAIRLDSTFVSAWRGYSTALVNLGTNPQRIYESYVRLYQLRDAIRSPALRANVVATYQLYIERNPAACLRTLQQAQSAPSSRTREGTFIALKGICYRHANDHESAIRIIERALKQQGLQPNPSFTQQGMRLYLDLGQLENAKSFMRQIESSVDQANPAVVALRDRYFAGTHQSDSMIAWGRTALENRSASAVSALRAMRSGYAQKGQLDSAAAIQNRLVDSTRSRDPLEAVRSAILTARIRGELLGDSRGALAQLNDALVAMKWAELPPLNRSYGELIELHAALGDVVTARQMVKGFQEQLAPVLRQSAQSEVARATGAVLLAEGKASEALTQFRRGQREGCRNCDVVFFARAFDKLSNADSTIYWLEKHLSTYSFSNRELNIRELPFAYRRLGELYEAKGDTKRAIQRYSDFVELWKNADPALQPLVKDVRERIARLQRKAG